MGAVWDWLQDTWVWGSWEPVRWKFFLAIILFLFSWVAYYILYLIGRIILKLVDKALPPTWKIDDDIKKYCLKPFCKMGKVVVWLFCIALLSFPDGTASKWLYKVCVAFFFWYILKLGLGIITVVSEAVLRNGKYTPQEVQQRRAVTKIVKALWVVIFGMIALQNLGVKIDNILAYTVVFVAGVTFAARDFMANFYGGLRIQMATPFVRGDRIKIESKWYNVEGNVAQVGLSDTTIKTIDEFAVVVPNHVFVREPIINLTKDVEQYATVTQEEADAHNPVADRLFGKKASKVKSGANL